MKIIITTFSKIQMTIKWLEHVNLNITSRNKAMRFYCGTLGGVLHPIGTLSHQIHVNLGLSQVRNV